ncbi:MAG: hypothetical protein M3P51_03400 [Chloroflexota bacterium]|nr:hypothetical protein [Chloroflexota bacterium]
MPKRSNEFQKVIHLICRQLEEGATVTESKFLRDRLSGDAREVDIVIEMERTLGRLTVSVECVDHARPATQEWVERMHAKHEHLPTDRLFLVSRAGFYKPAMRQAELRGVTALTLDEAMDTDWNATVRVLDKLYLAQAILQPTNWTVYTDPSKASLSPSDFDADPLVYDEVGREWGLLSQVAITLLKDNRIGLHLLETMDPDTSRTFKCAATVGDGLYLIDRSGIRRRITQLVIVGRVVAPARFPISLRHHAFRAAHIVRGLVNFSDGFAVFVAVEQEGVPGTAELRLPEGENGKEEIITFELVNATTRGPLTGAPPTRDNALEVVIQGVLTRRSQYS